jgi:dUTP pyrophosphatase
MGRESSRLPESAITVAVHVLPHAKGLDLPAYATAGSSGLDLRAAIGDELILRPGERCAVPTGLVLAIPTGFEGQVRPRSGLAHQEGITVLNSPGTIDSDYRGEVNVLLVNFGSEPVRITRGQRVAQLVFSAVTTVTLDADADLPGSCRGHGGFGHTGRT